MAGDSTTLLYRFLGIDEGAGAQFDKMAAKTALLGSTSSSAAAKVRMLTAGIGVGAVAVGIAAVKMASDFQRSMLLIQTQAGASAGEVKNFSKALLGMAGQVATSPDQLATALYHVYSTGLRGAQALQAVKIAAEGAKIGNADLEETTNALTSTIASGIKGTKNFGQAMGTLNAIVGSGDMKLSDLNEALGTGVLTAARVFNVSLKEAGAALAVFGDNNIRGADAATKLRMTMQDLAQPAAHADDVLSRIGLTSAKLRTDLARGGLTGALQDLRTHMDAAGITAGKVGPFIEQAFTKKAGVGLGILIDQIGRYNQKLHEGEKGAAGFGSAWDATTHTTAFVFARLRAEAQAAMISLGLRLLPAVTHVADMLGRDLPNAVARARQILAPLGQVAGTVLAGGFKTLGIVIHAAAVALGAVTDMLAKHRTLFTTVAVAVAGMWLAFKGYTIARTAVVALKGMFETIRLRAMYAREGVANLGSTMGGLSAASIAGGIALAGVGVALAALTMRWQRNKEQVAQAKAATAQYYGILEQTKGAINDTVIAQVTQTLAQNGAYDASRKLGLSLSTVTQAALGNKSALGLLTEALGHGNVKQVALLTSIGETAHELGDAQHQYKLASGQARENSTATDKNSTAQMKAKLAVQQTAAAVKKLATDLQGLVNTEISQLQTMDGFRTGLLQLKQQVKDNGTSLSQNTLKGLANRDALLSLASSAEKAAEGSKNYKAALLRNVEQLQAFATKAGFSKDQVNKLLTQMHLMPKQIKTDLKLNTAAVSSALNNLTPQAAQVAQNMAQAMKNSFRDAMQIRSPSRVFWRYGLQITEGLVKGIKSYSVKPEQVARELALGLITGWKNGTAKLKDALTSPVQAALNKLSTVVDAAISKQQDRLKTARDNLRNLLEQRKQDIASLAGSISSGAGLSGLFGTDANGNPSVTNVGTFLSGQAKSIENFAKDLNWAANHGLSTALLSEIAGLGADQGDQVLKQFMSGQASIKSANASEATIQRFATAGATAVEDKIYAKRVAADRKAVHDNTVELRNLTRTLRTLERNVAKQASTHLTIDAKTGRPVVDKKFIQDIIKGIREAERLAGKTLL